AAPVRAPAAERKNRGLTHARDRQVPPTTPRERPYKRRTRRDHHTHDLHHRIRRPLPIHRARAAVDRPYSRRQALCAAQRTRPLARPRPAGDRADRNPLAPHDRPASAHRRKPAGKRTGLIEGVSAVALAASWAPLMTSCLLKLGSDQLAYRVSRQV